MSVFFLYCLHVGMVIFWVYWVNCFMKIIKINFLCFFSLFKMAMRIFKITNVACVIFLLDSTTLDNYQKICFHSSTYSLGEKHSSQLLVTLRRQTTPTCEVDDAKLHGLCLPLQLPSGGSLQSCGHSSQDSPGSHQAQGLCRLFSLSEILSLICFSHLGLISNVTSSERPSLPSCGRQDNDSPKRSMSYCLEPVVMLSYKAKENFQI